MSAPTVTLEAGTGRCTRLGVLYGLLFGLLLAAGCSKDPMARQSVTSGVIAGNGIIIEAEDGSFRLESGRTFKPPFENDAWERGGLHLGPDLPSLWPSALELGARRVRIITPERETPLYGILLLNTHVVTATGLGAFNYRIELPPPYVEAASGGRVSVVHEDIVWGTGARWRSWILWLSDQPFGA